MDDATNTIRQSREPPRGRPQGVGIGAGGFGPWLTRAKAAQSAGRPREAIDAYNKALVLRPDDANAFHGKGQVLASIGRHARALACFDQALVSRPDRADIKFDRAIALQDLGRFEDALAVYDAMLQLEPDRPRLQINRGVILHRLQRFEEALAVFDRLLAQDPGSVLALDNSAASLLKLGRSDEAVERYRRSLELAPGGKATRANLGAILLRRGRDAEALDVFEEILRRDPDDERAHVHRSFVRLRRGDFKGGWQDYEWRRSGSRAKVRDWVAADLWLGKESLEGKSILVRAEQGLGDTLQFSRYLDLIASRGGRVVFQVQDQLHALIARSFKNVEVIKRSHPKPATDFHTRLVSLPLAFGTELEKNLPNKVPYLVARPERIERWRKWLETGADENEFRIGIAWRGKFRESESIPDRSAPLTQFYPLAGLRGVRVVSLQKNEGVEQLGAVPSNLRIESPGDDFDSGPDAFEDTAALMTLLDLVVTIDTSIAHLAGALGRPVFVALKCVSDWRWMLDRSDSPWYPTMRLFRQSRPGDWDGVFRDITQAVTAQAGLRASGA